MRVTRHLHRYAVGCLALAVGLLLSGIAAAQMPRAVITGPKEAALGDMVCLDASQSEGTSRLWLLAVSPVPKSFMPVDQGLRCVFATGTPGRYVFVLVAAGTNPNGGPAVDMTTHEIQISGKVPDVPPPPVVPPDPPTPPVNAGRRLIIILRESAAKDTQTATTVLQLRTDETFLAALRSKNHPPPLVLDPDQSDPLVALVMDAARRNPNAPSLKLPLLAVADYSSGDRGPIVHVQAMPADLVGVQAALQKSGG